MRPTRLDDSHRGHTWLLAFDAGDRVVERLRDFARAHDVGAAHFHAIGAFRSATLAFWDVAGKRYEEHDVDEQVEVCSLIGDVARLDGDVRIHAHAVLGRRDLSTLGGHLVEAEVNPTLELFLWQGDAVLERRHDEASGLQLL